MADKSWLILFSFDTCMVFWFLRQDNSLNKEGAERKGRGRSHGGVKRTMGHWESSKTCLNTAADRSWHSCSSDVMSSCFQISNPCWYRKCFMDFTHSVGNKAFSKSLTTLYWWPKFGRGGGRCVKHYNCKHVLLHSVSWLKLCDAGYLAKACLVFINWKNIPSSSATNSAVPSPFPQRDVF